MWELSKIILISVKKRQVIMSNKRRKRYQEKGSLKVRKMTFWSKRKIVFSILKEILWIVIPPNTVRELVTRIQKTIR